MPKILILMISMLTISACGTKSGHTPDAFAVLAPAAKPINKISRAIYNRKLNKVKQYLGDNYEALKSETKNGRGKHLGELIPLISNNKNQSLVLAQKLQQQHDDIFNNSRELVMRIDAIAARLAGQKGRMLPFNTRIELLNEIKKDYNSYRLAVKNREISRVRNTANILSIPQDAQQAFFAQLFGQYHSMFIDAAATKMLRIGQSS